MNTGMTTNIQTTIEGTKAEYCRLKDYQTKLTSDFEAEIAAMAASVAKLALMLNPIAALNIIVATTAAKYALATADMAAKMSKYAELASDLAGKLTEQQVKLQEWFNSLTEEEKAKYPQNPDGSLNVDAYCQTLPKSQNTW